MFVICMLNTWCSMWLLTFQGTFIEWNDLKKFELNVC